MSRRRLSFPLSAKETAAEGTLSKCSLCFASHTQLSGPASWKNDNAKEIAYKQLNLTDTSLVCRLCRDDISRIINNPSSIPRWEKPVNRKVTCCIKDCPSTAFVHTQIASSKQIEDIFSCENIPCPAPLCKKHYHTVYDTQKEKQTNCYTCNASLRCTTRIRTCPNPKVVQEFLAENTGFEGTIPHNAQICSSCYKAHLMITKIPPKSKDEDLELLISEMKKNVLPILSIKSTDDITNRALYSTAVQVGERLLNQEAFHLPFIYRMFTSTASAIAIEVGISLKKQDLHTAQWLLSNLVVCLQHHISYTIYSRKHGTLLYRTNGNFLKSLSFSVHKNEEKNEKVTIAHETNCTNTHDLDTKKNILDDLNFRLHQQIDKFTGLYNFDKLNIDKLVSEIDPELWTFITSITRCRTERKGYQVKSNQPETTEHHVTRIRCLFSLCVLMFCTDDRCSAPFHILLADIVESFGGSTQLISILNRLGVCSSVDTLARHIQYKVQEREKQGPEKECDSNYLTIISIDNIDFQHSYARVFCGKQTSSWHGTTVQAVQPMFPLLNSQTHTTSSATTQQCTAVDLVGKKRVLTTRSPFSSPDKVPVPKKKRRARTGMEGVATTTVPSCNQTMLTAPVHNVQTTHATLALNDFKLNTSEEHAISKLQKDMNAYVLIQNSVAATLSIQEYMAVLSQSKSEKSNIIYLQVLDAVSESKDTLITILSDLQKSFILGQKKDFLVVTADAKIYEILQSLKHEYGDEFHWLLPFPGDWHLLKNFQIALMKPYFDMGFNELAKISGYPTLAIQNCSQFKRTHHFLTEVWQALYQIMLQRFIEDDTEPSLNLPEIVYNAHLEIKCDEKEFIAKIIHLQHKLEICNYHEKFQSFISTMSAKYHNWKFWTQFVFQDGLAYITLFLAIRSGNWDLRLGGIKMMASIFTAFDHHTCRKLIAQHLADVKSLPDDLVNTFRQGGFVVSLSGRRWHSEALDEAHETKINKDCKTSIVRPSKDYIRRVSGYIPYRGKCIQNFKKQLFPEAHKQESTTFQYSIISTNPNRKKSLANIEAQISFMQSVQHLPLQCTNNDLFNSFSKKCATPDQQHDMLEFRNIGQEEFEKYIEYYTLRKASVHPPTRMKRLQTLSGKKVTKKRLTQLDKDRRLVQKCLHKKLKWSKQTGQPIDKIAEQYIPIPLALADSNGIPIKGQKSNTTKALKGRYKDALPKVFHNALPTNWVPGCAIVEGMVMLNTTPLGKHKTFGEYAHFLYNRFITPHFSRGTDDVHLIFDTPGQSLQTPKCFEQARRDNSAMVSVGHTCDEITAARNIPSKWRQDVINCRCCKRNLVLFLSNYLLKVIPKLIKPGKGLLLAGCFAGDIQDTAWYITHDSIPQPKPLYTSNAEETDTRIWLHCKHVDCNKILIQSPDTDIYHIGLPLANENKDIIIQINPYNSKDTSYLQLSSLHDALKNDPDLSSIEPSILPQVLQTLYVATGCDYISFFSGIGKATFLNHFFQHAKFITSGQSSVPNTLADVETYNKQYEKGFLSFLRLVGVVYMKKHSSGFIGTTPEAYFNHFYSEKQTTLYHHCQWLENIQQCIWDRIQFENEMIPNHSSLYRHWKRVCWVIDLWRQADSNLMNPKPLSDYGWKINDTTLTVEWDSDSNIAAIKQRVDGLVKGCGCKTGCNTRRCGCRGKGKLCSEGCDCINCNNTAAILPNTGNEAFIQEIVTDSMPDDVDEIMEWVFGNEEYEYEHESSEDSDSD